MLQTSFYIISFSIILIILFSVDHLFFILPNTKAVHRREYRSYGSSCNI